MSGIDWVGGGLVFMMFVHTSIGYYLGVSSTKAEYERRAAAHRRHRVAATRLRETTTTTGGNK